MEAVMFFQIGEIVLAENESFINSVTSLWLWGYPLCLLIGGLIGWGMNVLKTQREILKLKAETIKLQAETKKLREESKKSILDQIVLSQNSNQQFNEAIMVATEKFNAFSAALDLEGTAEERIAAVNKARDEFFFAFEHQVLQRFSEFAQIEAELKRYDESSLSRFITMIVIFNMRRFRSWLDALNDHNLRKHLNRGAYEISEQRLTRLDDLLKDYRAENRKDLELRIEHAILALTQPGDTPPDYVDYAVT